MLIVDIGLPDGDGINLYQELQKNGRIPAIFLTAKDDEKDMLKAFDTGADDYVVKPFSIKVLLKRIEVVLKRKSNENIFMCGQVMLYSDRKQVFVGETEISLTLKEYQLLEYFIMNQNSRNFLKRLVYLDNSARMSFNSSPDSCSVLILHASALVRI